MSSQISPSDTAILQNIGTDVLRSFISVVVETWFVAIYSVLVVKACSILLHKDRRRHTPSIIMLALVLLIFLMDIVLWVMDVRNVVAELNTALIDTHPDALDQRYSKATDSVLKLSQVVDAVYAFMTILGDAIVLWRVQAFWSTGRERWFMLIPCTTWFVSVILTFLLSYCAARNDTSVTFGQFEHPAFCRNIQSAAYWAQFATAAVATGMIGIKTWMYRRMVKSFMSDMRHRSPVNKAMFILVDTGILYTLFFLAEVLLNIGVLDGAINKNPRLDFALEVYDFQTSSIVGIYPTVVVILVHTQCFMLDTQGRSTTALTTINFGDSAGGGGGGGGKRSRPSHRGANHNNTMSTSTALDGSLVVDGDVEMEGEGRDGWRDMSKRVRGRGGSCESEKEREREGGEIHLRELKMTNGSVSYEEGIESREMEREEV
ncbi:hypothetical protein BDY19DRAFT_930296 [Irpex rosettiformis]|uniref:Uncharacterized protein n=1 Tax=Irpex rosettiformis TaxID=378272 RepID=A0ACB8UAU3_9APHY|nr:hypothetical protein BDY19DRAFT_930296 [Irpex rosettiformis]